MILCVLNSKIDADCLYVEYDLYLYYLPVEEYKKQILKGNINTQDNENASICCWYAHNIVDNRFELGEEMISKSARYSYVYALHILNERFEIGEEMIKQSEYCRDYENHFSIRL